MVSALYCRSKFLLVTLLLLQGPVLFPQEIQPGDESSDTNQATFKISVGAVIVRATVSDKNGAPVNDLTPEDFRVYEDGKPQQIESFDLQAYETIQDSATTPGKPLPEATTTVEQGLPRPRMISIMIDDVASAPDDHFLILTEAVSKFIENDMKPGDKIAILSGSGRVQVPFSGNKQFLLAEAANLPKNLNWDPVERSECPALTDLQAQEIFNHQGDSGSLEVLTRETIKCLNLEVPRGEGVDADILADREENYARTALDYVRQAAATQYRELIYRNRALLASLRQHLRSLRYFDANKSTILFSDGFLRRDVTYELQNVVEEALRSGVVLNSVNVQGLSDPLFIPASVSSTSSADMNMLRAGASREDASAQEDPLHQLAYETGGAFFHNNNDLYQGIRQICDRNDYYYVLTYATSPPKPDGRYHSIKLEVLRPGLQVSYRKGYYAPREEMTFEQQEKEEILRALHAPGNLNEIPMGLSYNYYQDDDTTYAVSLLLKVDIRNLRFLSENSRRRNLIHMVVVAFDEMDRYVQGLEKTVDFRLTDLSYGSLLDSGVTSKVELTLPIGRYRIRAVVREATQGKMGSLTKTIEIP